MTGVIRYVIGGAGRANAAAEIRSNEFYVFGSLWGGAATGPVAGAAAGAAQAVSAANGVVRTDIGAEMALGPAAARLASIAWIGPRTTSRSISHRPGLIRTGWFGNTARSGIGNTFRDGGAKINLGRSGTRSTLHLRIR